MSNRARILLLEDDDDLRELLEEVLTDEGYEVRPASRGELAVELAGSVDFDLIIADIKMEGMGGLEAVERTKGLQPGIGSLVVSGYASELEAARAEKMNIGGFMKKPFDMTKLLQLIRQQLSSKQIESHQLERESYFHQALDWSLRALTSMVDDAGMAEGSLKKAANCAEEMARRLNCEPASVQAVRWATIFLGGEEILGKPLPSLLKKTHMDLPRLSELLQSAGQDGGEKATELQCINLALAEFLYLEGDKIDRAEYREDVLEALEELKAQLKAGGFQPQAQEPQSSQERRSLITLALALEKLGDWANSDRAFEQVCEESESEKEQLEARLGRARLALAQDQEQACREHSLESLRLAKARGPRALASRGLEAALMLEKIGAEEAVKGLSLVGQAAQEVEFTEALAVVRCALSQLEGKSLKAQHIEALSHGKSAQKLLPYLDWLFPYLTREHNNEERELLTPTLVNLTQEFPSFFLSCFEDSSCSAAQRVQLAETLAKANYLPTAVLEAFLKDSQREIRRIANTLRSRQRGKEASQLLRVQSFGIPKLYSQGVPLCESQWRTRKVKYLFFLLASQWGKGVQEDKLIEIFWPKASSRNKKNLYWATSGVRSVLKKLCQSDFDPLNRTETSLALDERLLRWHDLEVFTESLDKAGRLELKGDREGAIQHYMTACNVYIGPYLDGCFYDFAVDIKNKTEQKAIVANSKLGAYYLEQNQDELALEYSSNASELAPHSEDACTLFMRSLIRLGRGEKAVQVYESLAAHMKEEGKEVSTQLIELYHRARLGYTDA